ncbi:MAG: nicotinamide mononucleotide transporter [Sphingobacteriales bacterium]|nr:MAG: nicotinamide mononucleotide transporter [Sphingobacteriales bacterium]
MIKFDWIGVCFSLLGWYLMSKHRFKGLLVLFIANILWIIFGIQEKLYSLVFLQVSFIVLNIKTNIDWYNIEKSKPSEYQDESFKSIKKLFRQ